MKTFVDEQKPKNFADTTISCSETMDGDHGRIETRKFTVIHDVELLINRRNWRFSYCARMTSEISGAAALEIWIAASCAERWYFRLLWMFGQFLAPLKSSGATRTPS